MVKCICFVNQSIYTEMVLSSKHLTYTSLHDQNLQAMESLMRMIGVEPNPNFIFKGTSIENERYLIYRFMISIFQYPSDKIIHFSDEHAYRQFCQKYCIEEFDSIEWFRTSFYMGSWEEAIDYFTQNSLIFRNYIFQEMDFKGLICHLWRIFRPLIKVNHSKKISEKYTLLWIKKELVSYIILPMFLI